MTGNDSQTIRMRPDGSIDTAYYMARGRVVRSNHAIGTKRGVLRRILSLGTALRNGMAAKPYSDPARP